MSIKNIDLLSNYETKKDLYNNAGGVELIDMMPRIVPEDRFGGTAVACNARVSYMSDSKSSDADNKLLGYLLRHKHMSPFESVTLKFKITCPLYVARQWMRHRTFSYNEASARYTKVSETWFLPQLRMQCNINKQSSNDDGKIPDEAIELWEKADTLLKETWETYNKLLDLGCAREVVRSVLPVGMMTTFIVTGNLRNWLHFLHLRMASDAQKEIRSAADAIYELLQHRFPFIMKDWDDYTKNATVVPKSWADELSNKTQSLTGRSKKEFDKATSGW